MPEHDLGGLGVCVMGWASDTLLYSNDECDALGGKICLGFSRLSEDISRGYEVGISSALAANSPMYVYDAGN
jgi:hypothetical protein